MLEGQARVIFVCDVCIYKEIIPTSRNISAHSITAAQIFKYLSNGCTIKGLLPNLSLRSFLYMVTTVVTSVSC
jgi:hypothetical protein